MEVLVEGADMENVRTSFRATSDEANAGDADRKAEYKPPDVETIAGRSREEIRLAEKVKKEQ